MSYNYTDDVDQFPVWMNNYVRQHMRDTAGLRGPKQGIKSVYPIDFIEFVQSLPGNQAH